MSAQRTKITSIFFASVSILSSGCMTTQKAEATQRRMIASSNPSIERIDSVGSSLAEDRTSDDYYRRVISDFSNKSAKIWDEDWVPKIAKIRVDASKYSRNQLSLTAGGILSNIAAVTLMAASPANIPTATGLTSFGTGILTFQVAGAGEGYTRKALIASADRTEQKFMEAAEAYAIAESDMRGLVDARAGARQAHQIVTDQLAKVRMMMKDSQAAEGDKRVAIAQEPALEKLVERRSNELSERESAFPLSWAEATRRAAIALNKMKAISARGIISEASEQDIAQIKAELDSLRTELKERLQKPAADKPAPAE
jgi:hypothetical protein